MRKFFFSKSDCVLSAGSTDGLNADITIEGGGCKKLGLARKLIDALYVEALGCRR